MASLLASRGVTLDFVVDEGGPILVDGLPSLLRTSTQIALVGTAEKVRHGMSFFKAVFIVSASQVYVQQGAAAYCILAVLLAGFLQPVVAVSCLVLTGIQTVPPSYVVSCAGRRMPHGTATTCTTGICCVAIHGSGQFCLLPPPSPPHPGWAPMYITQDPSATGTAEDPHLCLPRIAYPPPVSSHTHDAGDHICSCQF